MRLLIVDDEVIIRNGLSTVINWQELGFELLSPAASAEEALSRFQQEKPHIVLTDIHMTGMNGLELAAELKKQMPDTEVIILTGYDTFTYAQQAIREGVSDYLLKMSRPEEIIMAAMKAKQRIVAKQQSKKQDIQSRIALRDQLLERLLTEGERKGPLADAIGELLPLLAEEEQLYQVLLLAASGWGDDAYHVSLAQFAVSNMVQELIEGEALLRKDHIVLAIRHDAARPFHIELERISRKLKCKLFTAAGSVGAGRAHLQQSYVEAAYAFTFHWIAGEDAQLSFEDVRARKGGRTVCSQEDETLLVAVLKSGSAIELRRWVDAAVAVQLADDQLTPDSLHAYLHSIVISGHRWLERALQAVGEAASPSDEHGQELLARSKSPQEALFNQLAAVMDIYREHVTGERVPYVKRAVAFIADNLDKNLTLQQVAKHVHLNPNHFSEVFKRETGLTYIEFVTKERMRRAMELLKQSPAKISEIAGLVGYEDVKYFSQLFKKTTGKTPSEYRLNT
ncbi:response regulator [Paenibacillus sp. MMS18-CY102]|uniref:response regulator n=1 Tax=Paenibacillus sp. MMS18-CY102 TaxID=2682849 RepID=UPI0013653D29|nr:response regulator [Paenibacillus sp. MMS18-CY102]MWC28841.1 response regulator [Paenibacillus sp. MMS18-CY102]